MKNLFKLVVSGAVMLMASMASASDDVTTNLNKFFIYIFSSLSLFY
jgi:hypothetical protein